MRTVLLLLVAMLAIKTTAVTTASGQEACTKAYTGCLDRCVGRPTASLQETCMATCQTQSTACFSQVYGGPGPSAQTVREEPANRQTEAADQPPAPAEVQKAPAKKRATKPAVKTAKPAESTQKPAESAQ